MKKPSFKSFSAWWERRRAFHLPVWILLHVLVFLPLVFTARLSVNSDLYSILPGRTADPARAEAERRIQDDFGSGFTILVGHADFDKARALAVKTAAGLRAVSGLRDVACEIDAGRLAALQDFLFRYRYQLLSPEVRAALASGDTAAVAERAFARLSSPVSLGSLDHLDLDPFLLADASLEHYLGQGLVAGMAVGLKDGVLAADHDGKSWVLITGRTAGSGMSVQSDDNPVAAIRRIAGEVGASDPAARFVFSGAPFHSYESARSSQSAITILSTVSMIFIVLLLLFFFRSAKPLLFTLAATVLAVGAGLAAAFLVFGEIHLFTIVFGTSLIGISIDYALNYFAAWATPPRSKPFGRALGFVLPGICLALFTTLASYAGFLVTSFPLLQQMALFSIVGLTSGFLSVACVFPRLGLPAERTVRFAKRAGDFLLHVFERVRSLKPAVKLTIGVVLLAAVAIGLTQVRLKNEVQSLYRMSAEMKQDETLSAAILNHGSTGIYALVEGKDDEDARVKEEELLHDLAAVRSEGKLGSALGATLFVPSEASQSADYKLAGAMLAPAAAGQLAIEGFGAREAAAWRADYARQKDRRVTWTDFENLPLGSLARALRPSAIQGRVFQAVLLFRITDPAAVKTVVQAYPGRVFVDTITDVNAQLGTLSVTAFIVICLSYAVILGGLMLRYGLKRGAAIVFIPALASAAGIALLSACGLPFNIFSVMGLILVPGMGTDYVIFFTEGRSRPAATVLAITLCVLTTVMSFGILGFIPLAQVFGLTVAVGILLSFVLTPLLAVAPKPESATGTPRGRTRRVSRSQGTEKKKIKKNS